MATGLMTLTLKPAPWSNWEQDDEDTERHVQISTNCTFYKVSDHDFTCIVSGGSHSVTVKETPEEILLLIREVDHLEKLVRDK